MNKMEFDSLRDHYLQKMQNYHFYCTADNTEFINNITENAEHTRNNTVLTCWLDIMQKAQYFANVWSQSDTVRHHTDIE